MFMPSLLPLFNAYWLHSLLLGLLFTMAHLSAAEIKWSQFDSPSRGQVAAIGSYANGCLSGAQALPLKGEGFQVIRTTRNRFYGHPQLVSFIETFAKQTQLMGMDDLLIGDISMARGGNFEFGHSSHQIGLDADIWFRQAEQQLSEQARENPQALDLVDRQSFSVNQYWQTQHAEMIRLAALSPEVARIFVNPAIKQQLCTMTWADPSWLNKVRPWWGHSLHMHVRLTCPTDDPLCQNQQAPPLGTGCDELDWWKQQMTVANNAKQRSAQATSRPKPKVMKVKPEQCMRLLSQTE